MLISLVHSLRYSAILLMRGILWQAYRGQKHKLLEHNKGTKSQRLGNASAEDQLIAEGKTVQIIAGGAVKPAAEE
uniref:Uncharacterized protein n=1 Tax=Siphoviridae sp. ctg0K17 TaxID=2825600 RepID=A0A8S5PVX8_9CAUD|nr:MAG TPA: hypothetical protein [Siphoviridae sp. ctg0K17]